MEIGVISYNTNHECYRIANEYFDVFSLACDSSRKQSLEELRSANCDQGKLGIEAEKLVVSYEQHRLGEIYSHHVVHVALENVAAGYDIRSLTINKDGSHNPRFIEVKAVPKHSFQFYWSRNEISTAKKLAAWYYIYLLPVKEGRHFLIDEIKIIANPYSVIFGEESTWKTEIELLKCCQQINGTKKHKDSSNVY